MSQIFYKFGENFILSKQVINGLTSPLSRLWNMRIVKVSSGQEEHVCLVISLTKYGKENMDWRESSHRDLVVTLAWGQKKNVARECLRGTCQVYVDHAVMWEIGIEDRIPCQRYNKKSWYINRFSATAYKSRFSDECESNFFAGTVRAS